MFTRGSIYRLLLVSLLLLCLVGVVYSQDGASSLTGELEGARIVTDVAEYPTTFHEAPMLAEMVANGELPRLEERLPAPEDVLVIEPLDAIGEYGGTWRRGFTGPGDLFNARRAALNSNILFTDFSGTTIVPGVAKSWEVSEDGTTFTLHLRRGLKWSDGTPFTADAFVFWFENMHLNEEFNPSPQPTLSINGQSAELVKVDDFTVQYVFPEANFLFLDILASAAQTSGHGFWGYLGQGGYAPGHYLQQFHPDFATEDELNAALQDSGFDNWVDLLKARNDVASNPDVPTLTPWRVVATADNPVYVLERNPYYYGVDTEGNQLPYIDRIEMTLAEDLDVLNLRAVAGEYDFQARHIDARNIPTLIENQEQGNYTLHLDQSPYGSNILLFFQATYDDDADIAALINNRDFRQALAIAIDREQVNETFALGLGRPSSIAPVEGNLYYPGDEYKTMFTQYDPDTANQMLDSVGLTERDAEGFRMRPDGSGRLRLTLSVPLGSFVAYEQVAEMLADQFREIGIEVIPEGLERSLWTSRVQAGELQLSLWDNGGTENVFTVFDNLWQWAYPTYTQWMNTAGGAGVEPPERIKEAMELWLSGATLPLDERVEAGKALWQILVEEAWQIGIVGHSPLVLATRVVSNDMGNSPSAQLANVDCFTPSCSRPEQFYFTNPERR